MTILITTEESEPEGRAITSDTLVWNGITIMVSYEADWMGLAAKGLDYPSAHLELQVVEPKRAPLPVTDTGYRSEFLSSGLVEEAGGPKAFAEAWLDNMAGTKCWLIARAKWNQLDLFQLD